MKNLYLIGVFFFSISAKSQVHWLINQDAKTNCEIIKSGKFVNEETDCKITPGYYMVFKDGYLTEYVEDGKYYIKSKLEFDGLCKYKSTTVEWTIPNFKATVGDILYTEILETATIDNLVKIRSRSSGDWQIFVLKKID